MLFGVNGFFFLFVNNIIHSLYLLLQEPTTVRNWNKGGGDDTAGTCVCVCGCVWVCSHAYVVCACACVWGGGVEKRAPIHVVRTASTTARACVLLYFFDGISRYGERASQTMDWTITSTRRPARQGWLNSSYIFQSFSKHFFLSFFFSPSTHCCSALCD